MRRTTLASVTTPEPTQEGLLIESARKNLVPSISARKAAAASEISESRWRQIVNGFTQVTSNTAVPTSAPPDTLARMARTVRVTPTQLREAGRNDAADILARLISADDTEKAWDGDLTTVPHRELLAELERRLDENVYAEHRERRASVSDLASRRKNTPTVSPASYRDGIPEDAVADSSDEVGGTPDDFEP